MPQKFVIVPDVHGEDFWKEAIDLVAAKNYKAIFLGDYFDSYRNIPRDKELKNFQEILDFKEADPDKVTLLLGNHDIAYMLLKDCSRQATDSDFISINNILWDNIEKLALTCKIKVSHVDGSSQKVLCSHAGITDAWLNWIIHTLNWEMDYEDLFHAITSGMLDLMLLRSRSSDRNRGRLATVLWQVGPSRGGDSVGSLIWADRHEWPRYAPGKAGCKAAAKRGVYQFVGHSRCGVCKFTDDVFCFDAPVNKIQLVD